MRFGVVFFLKCGLDDKSTHTLLILCLVVYSCARTEQYSNKRKNKGHRNKYSAQQTILSVAAQANATHAEQSLLFYWIGWQILCRNTQTFFLCGEREGEREAAAFRGVRFKHSWLLVGRLSCEFSPSRRLPAFGSAHQSSPPSARRSPRTEQAYRGTTQA
jgi:hypothetical protein